MTYIVQKNLISEFSEYKFPNYRCGKHRGVKQGNYKILQNKHGGHYLLKKEKKLIKNWEKLHAFAFSTEFGL